MAQEKLLRLLRGAFGKTYILLAIGMVLLLASQSQASALELDQKNDQEGYLGERLQRQASDTTWQYLVSKLKEARVYGEDLTEGLSGANVTAGTSGYELKIFVSHSMPLALLKTYAKEAKKYGGTMIFKGLPNDSFKDLQQLVMSLGAVDELGSMQIDQESFENYGIASVPAVVLAQSENCFEGQSCKSVFDKITGNVGLRYALETFKDEGELGALARGILEQ